MNSNETVVSKLNDVSRFGADSMTYPARVGDTKLLGVSSLSTRDDLKHKLLKCREIVEFWMRCICLDSGSLIISLCFSSVLPIWICFFGRF